MASEAGHPLKAFLQLQLASDSSAVLHLPSVFSALSPDSFSPSPHLQKWTARVNSLVHAQDFGARWAGLCLAYRTAVLSKPVMLECAHSWIGAALPMLSKNEPLPNLKAAIRLLRYIFSGATDTPEFQRQLVTPNIPKYSQAIIALAEKQDDADLKILALNTLTMLVPLYPTLHKALHGSLSSLTLRFLNGTAPTPLSSDLVKAASRLYAVLHYTGGKVGAAGQWRKSLDDTLAFTWSALNRLLSTFSNSGGAPNTAPATGDALTNVALNTDRLRCGITVLCALLRSTSSRPVQVPINSVLQLVTAMLSYTQDEQVSGPIDQSLRAVENSAIPLVWSLGCDLLVSFVNCVRYHLTPHVPRLLTIVAYHLEQQSLTPQTRLAFLRALPPLLSLTHPSHDAIALNRLTRAILPSLTIVLLERQADTAESSVRKSRKGKKRQRGYEGDELFNVAREVICPSPAEGEVVLAALDALQALSRNPHLSPAVQSLSGRILLSMLLSLPQIPKGLLSPDLRMHGRLLAKVQSLCVELGVGTTSTMSKSLGLVVKGLSGDNDRYLHVMDLMVHPRLPPLLRPLPHVESLSLFRGEEGEEEAQLRESLHLVPGEISVPKNEVQHLRSDYDAPRQPPRTSFWDPVVPRTSVPSEPVPRSTEAITKATVAPLHAVSSTPSTSKAPPQPSPIPEAMPTLPARARSSTPSLPPPPEPLNTSQAGPWKIPVRIPEPEPIPVRVEEEEDEEMPAINVDSDSEGE